MDCFLRAFPRRLRQSVRMRAAKTLKDLVAILECTLRTPEMGRGKKTDPEKVTW